MRESLIRFAVRLYPAGWRHRYGVEFAALLDDAGRNWRDVWDVLMGALKMQMTTWGFGKIALGSGVTGALLFCSLSFIVMPDKYTSDAVLRLQTSVLSGEAPTADKAKRFVITLMQNTESRDSLAGIIENQGLYQRERARNGMEDAIEKMRRDIRFERIGDSDAFHVRFQYGDARQAQLTEQELMRKLIAPKVTILAGTQQRFTYKLEVIDSASLPRGPSSPNRFLIASLGLAAGLLLGVAAMAIARARSTTDPAGNSPKPS